MQVSFGEPEHLSHSQLKVIKGKHHDKCSDNTAKLEYFSYGERLVPNAKIYCINLNDFSLETFKIHLKRSEKFGFPMIFSNLCTKSP